MPSPTLIMAAGVGWKALVVLTVPAMPERAARAAGRRDTLNAIVHSFNAVRWLAVVVLVLSADGWLNGHKAKGERDGSSRPPQVLRTGVLAACWTLSNG